MDSKFESGALLTMLAETHLHVGAGRSTGVVDLPVAREAVTGFPHLPENLPETGLKGALRQMYRRYSRPNEEETDEPASDEADIVKATFGSDAGAGTILFSTGRLLLLPLRRLDHAYAWATCPLILERLWRDLDRSRVGESKFAKHFDALKSELSSLGELTCGEAYSLDEANSQDEANSKEEALSQDRANEFFLEERRLERIGPVSAHLVELLEHLMPGEAATKARIARQVVVLSDADFAWYCEYGLPVAARNRLDDVTKESKSLWYEETLPTDTLLYALALPRPGSGRAEDHCRDLFSALVEEKWLQIGGNETVGQGWVRIGLTPLPPAKRSRSEPK